MYQFSDWKCGSCERSFCIAIDDEETKGKDTCVCPHCGSKSVTPEAESGPPTEEDDQPGAAAPLGMAALLDTVRDLNNPGDSPQAPLVWASIDLVFARGTLHTCAGQVGAPGLVCSM